MKVKDLISQKLDQLNNFMGESEVNKEYAEKLKATKDTTVKASEWKSAKESKKRFEEGNALEAGLAGNSMIGQKIIDLASPLPGEIARSWGNTLERFNTPKGRKEDVKSLGRVLTSKPGMHTLKEPIVEDVLNVSDLAFGGTPGLTVKTVKGAGKKAVAKKAAEPLALPAPKTFEGFSDYTTKTLKALKGKDVMPAQQIKDTMNKLNLRPVERSIIEDALSKWSGKKVGVDSLAKDVKAKLPKFETKETSGWDEYSLGSVLDWDTDYKVNTTNAPKFQWENQSTHFNTGDGQLYHSRLEDLSPEYVYPSEDEVAKYANDKMAGAKVVQDTKYDGTSGYRLVDKDGGTITSIHDTPEAAKERALQNFQGDARSMLKAPKPGGARVVSEIQSDVMQENRWKKQLPPSAEELTEKQLGLSKSAQQFQDRAEKRELFAEKLPQILNDEGLVPGLRMMDQPIFKKFVETEAPKRSAIDPDASRWRIEDNLLDEFSNGLSSKYGLERWEFQDAISQADNPDLISNRLRQDAANDTVNSQAQFAEAEAIKAKLDAGVPITPEEQQKLDFFDAFKGDKWWQFGVRNEINKAAKAGKDEVLFPKGDTAAKIEKYVNKGDESAIEYSDYSVGETAYDNWEGENVTVLERDGNSVRVANQDKVNDFDYEDFLSDEQNNYLDDFDSYKEELLESMPLDAKMRLNEIAEEMGENLEDLDPDKVLAQIDEEFPDWRDTAAENLARNNIGDSAEDVARYYSDNFGGEAFTDGDRVYTLEDGTEPRWVDMDESNGEFPEDIKGELGSDQMNVYNFYDKSIAEYLQKLKHLGEAEDTVVDGEAFTRFKPNPGEATDGTELFNFLPPMALGGATLAGGAMATKQKQQQPQQRY